MNPQTTRRLRARIRRRLKAAGAELELAQLERLSPEELELIVALEAGCGA